MTNYELNRLSEKYRKRVFEMGFHNAMSELIEYAVITPISKPEKKVNRGQGD